MFQTVDPKALPGNVFAAIGQQWMLITAGTAGHCNTMTASWGGLGVLWGEPMATVFIRPQRYTKEFVDGSDYFTLSFFDEAYRPQRTLFGSKSGRDGNKAEEGGFTVGTVAGGAPYFAQARVVLVCRKVYRQKLDPAAMPPQVREKWYDGDYHEMYFGQIVEALVREEETPCSP